MKNIIKYSSGLAFLVFCIFFTTKSAFADMLPPGNLFYKVPKDERAGLLEIIEPQYILIGVTIIVGIIASFALIAKLRDGEEKSKKKRRK